MKLSTLTLALFTSLSLAAPIEPTPQHALYTLRVSSKYAKEIDGAYLTVSPTTSQLGIFPASNPSESFIKFYPVPSGRNVELHRYTQTTAQDQVIAFVGSGSSPGLLDLSVAAPTATPAAGTTCDWKSFDLVENPTAAGKPDNLVTYGGGAGNWVAFPGKDGWTVNWRSADAVTIEKRSYMMIDVVYEPVMVAQTGVGGGVGGGVS